MKPNKSNLSTLKQICQLIPPHIVNKLAKKHGIKTRKLSSWSHVVSLLYTQLSHALSLNDVCDGLHYHSSSLFQIRGATAPKRNTFSNANRTRNAAMAEDLFWEVLKSLQSQLPSFGLDKQNSNFPQRFKRAVYAVDSTTIQLVAHCLDWAKHRRRKAAAKCHMQLNLQTFLPSYAIVKEANTHDSTEAKEMCANIKDGEIVVFDKAYVDFRHLYHLDSRGVNWVTRSKDNMVYDIIEERPTKGNIISDQIIKLNGINTEKHYSQNLRLVTANIEVDGKMKVLMFLTNNLQWAPSSIASIYQSRWGIEVFFKQLKQNLKLADFLGHNKNAIQWQVWTALLTYVLLRFLAFRSQWPHSFSRITTLIRGVLWSYFDLSSLLKTCGTASDPPKIKAVPDQAYLPNFDKAFYGTACV
ncbi:ISPg4, transposase [Lentisphaera araneosa HTCC2155]|uniref:ISPg4, transposase n=1 Tax=Lentisphaera araneosa HTCC2155 TaxID=313628 RepID=A6DKD2_9BACT|nr:IS4 family transposase [Lentisphaera araneosa]EDM27830.1 ISPg4, transposase [Lentisphaera araneosa HTCC2155]